MARSKLTELQLRDEDVLTESEHSSIDHTVLVSGTQWITANSDVTTVKGGSMFVDTTISGFTATLFSNPVIGDTYTFIDYVGGCSTNPLTISGGGEKINGTIDNLYLDVANRSITLIYSTASVGWIIKV